MKLTRRETLGVLASAGAVGLVADGCAPPAGRLLTPTAVADADARFLNRAGFGPRPGDVEAIKSIGRENWLDQQLEPAEEPWDLKLKVGRIPANNLLAWELRDWPKRDVIRQAQQNDMLYAVYSPWQLRERMVDFWTNHFNIYGNKGLAAYRIPTDQRDVIRKNAVGSFPAMVRASAKSTAMLLYLDQQASHYGQPNENYARELLELHTLGVNGGYTQRDVMEVARCFTGWTEERRSALGRVFGDGSLGQPQGTFRFDKALHDVHEKTVLGVTIPAGGGVEDGEQVVDVVTRHSSTARHLARKLCTYFLGDDGPLVEDQVATAYLQEPIGDISRMLKAIFLSPMLDSCSPTFKRPFDFTVSALRVLGAETDGNAPLLRHLELMGQPTHMWPMPDGYPMDATAWNGSVLGRWNFAIQLCTNRIKGTSVDLDALAKRFGTSRPEEWARVVLGGTNEPIDDVIRAFETTKTIDASPPKRRWDAVTAICLCAPEFQWK